MPEIPSVHGLDRQVIEALVDGGARLERVAESAQRVTVRARAKRLLAHPAPFARVEAEAEQRRHQRALAAPTSLDRDKLRRFGIAHDEQHVEDSQGPAALDPLDRADQPALDSAPGADP